MDKYIIYKSPGVHTIEHDITIVKTGVNWYRLSKIKKVLESISSKPFGIKQL